MLKKWLANPTTDSAAMSDADTGSKPVQRATPAPLDVQAKGDTRHHRRAALRQRNYGVVLLMLGLLAALCLPGPIYALAAGAVLALMFNHIPAPFVQRSGSQALQIANVLLGFRLDGGQLLDLGASSGALIIAWVPLSLALGIGLATVLKVTAPSAQLVAAGTAICGGTTIAALSPILKARPGYRKNKGTIGCRYPR